MCLLDQQVSLIHTRKVQQFDSSGVNVVFGLGADVGLHLARVLRPT